MDYKQVLWAFMIGVSCAAVYLFLVRRFLGTFVRKLLEHDAFTPETAVGFEDIEMKNNFFIKRSLRPGTDFSQTVLEHEGKYYIPEDKLEKAESKYKSATGGVLILFLAIIIFAVVTAVAVYVFPHLAEMFTNLFSSGEN